MSATFLRRDRRSPKNEEPVTPSPAPRTRSLPVRRTALVRMAVWATVATGPLALISSCARSGEVVRTQPVPAARAGDTGASSPDPAGYAELFLGLWLRSGSDEDGAAARQLRAMAPSVQPPLWGEHVPAVEQLTAVRSLRQADGAWSVTVAVQFKQTEAGAPDKVAPGLDGALRYFALPLVIKDAGMSVGAARAFVVPAAPMEVAAPAVLEEPSSPYGTQVPDGSPLATTVGEFLTAYLGAAEGAGRYLAPGITLPASTSTPFTAVHVDAIHAAGRTDGTASADGGATRVQAQITASDADGGRWPLSYALQLKARDGRWEITGLQSGLEASPGKKETSDTTSSRRGTATGVQVLGVNATAAGALGEAS
ncbi:conjugal transfer protein (plasmid) [Streptomyces scopuliridis]|uniref:conjugal transfer protein n=1 Tax=Streptomyces scopuliridis TaxID=452529 RepID=UPI002DD8AA59|nr:conjugal transfer protein [Streptomyces scopuliridis]WSB39020.1 conjugal transfer protein [Streptomyces scopuliridis]